MSGFRYTKLGQVFSPEGERDWMQHYAAPVTSVEFEHFIRVYFTTRSLQDPQGNFTTYITFLDCRKDDPTQVLRVHDRPLLEMGRPGTFDEHGTMVAEVFRHAGRYWMYYMGWQRSDTVPYLNRLGLAISEDGESFERVSEGPVVGINRHVPFGIGNVSILVEDGRFHMWFTCYQAWIETQSGFRPNYDIRYCSSGNGLDWDFGPACILPEGGNEALATPCVRWLDGRYHMWYSYRPAVDSAGQSGPYRIGYAISNNRIEWTRADAAMGLAVSAEGWDAEMVCYPDVVNTSLGRWLFYCGNGYGRQGFGCARIESI